MIIIENFGFSQSSFYFEKYFINMIGDALKLNQVNKDELFNNIYQNDEKKLLKWAEKIKAKCPEYLTKFLDFTGLSNDLVTEEYKGDATMKLKIKESEIPFESKRNNRCPYWYIFKHGIGPGTIPEDVKVGKVKDLDNYYSIVWLDRPLSTKELKYYDIYPETMNRQILKGRLGYSEEEIDNLLIV